MNVLMPIISRKEDNENFIRQALKKAKQITILIIIDLNLKLDETGLTAGNIAIARKISEKIKQEANKKKKKATEVIEWGSTKNKIIQTAKLKNIDKIVLVKQENEFFNSIIKELKKAGIKTEEIKLNEKNTK